MRASLIRQDAQMGALPDQWRRLNGCLHWSARALSSDVPFSLWSLLVWVLFYLSYLILDHAHDKVTWFMAVTLFTDGHIVHIGHVALIMLTTDGHVVH